MKKKKKKYMALWWIGTISKNLVVSDRISFTDGRTTDARVTTVALLSSSTKEIKILVSGSSNDIVLSCFSLDISGEAKNTAVYEHDRKAGKSTCKVYSCSFHLEDTLLLSEY